MNNSFDRRAAANNRFKKLRATCCYLITAIHLIVAGPHFLQVIRKFLNLPNVSSNSMTDLQIIELIEKEFKYKTLGATEQYLEIHSPVYSDNQLKVERIDREGKDKLIVGYIPVIGERFYFAVYIDIEANEIINIGTEAKNSVYFRADSDKFSLMELSKMTTLESTGGRNKGDERRNGIFWKESTIFFEPNKEPDEFEDKLNKLLSFLEQDRTGILKLVEKADGYIQIAIEFHNGNTMLGGPHIDKKVIKRMNDLGVSINFDLYVGGKSFKE
ncbi:DUF4279 domain-containing protein [Pedobacter psychrophilus]|uniref:DUF4279 domain-containing protein n=1 Tax=Pedobacter psychrophilus TaxID=1826909 RepID=UPI0012FE1E15|nr:DUF4279 domain-containing protein [Pedobacter psychrophilus]